MKNIDPNLLILVIGALVTSTKWLWAKLHKEKTESITDALWTAIEGNVVKLAESDETVDSIRAKLTKAAYEALDRYGLKRSTSIDVVVAMLVDKGITEARKRILARKELEAAAASMLGAAGGVKVEVQNPTVPKLGDGLPGEVQVTVVQP